MPEREGIGIRDRLRRVRSSNRMGSY